MVGEMFSRLLFLGGVFSPASALGGLDITKASRIMLCQMGHSGVDRGMAEW